METSLERWNTLCAPLEVDDGLPVWQAGAWTQDKLFFWMRYIEITTNAMHGKDTFPDGLVYVDLFGGAGVCELRKSHKRFPGSALIAASARKPFSKIIVCEKDTQLAAACQSRLSRTLVANRCLVFEGDCNRLIDQVVSVIPRDALTLAFIDPKGLDIDFETVRKLSAVRHDLVILFADAYDIARNQEAYYRRNPNSKLDRVLGPDSAWRSRLDALESRNAANEKKLFADIYKDQLQKHLHYTQFDDEVIKLSEPRSRSIPLYRLIYASKHKLGLKFWREAKGKDASGQGKLFH